jgi:hypothetical protein
MIPNLTLVWASVIVQRRRNPDEFQYWIHHRVVLGEMIEGALGREVGGFYSILESYSAQENGSGGRT